MVEFLPYRGLCLKINLYYLKLEFTINTIFSLISLTNKPDY